MQWSEKHSKRVLQLTRISLESLCPGRLSCYKLPSGEPAATLGPEPLLPQVLLPPGRSREGGRAAASLPRMLRVTDTERPRRSLVHGERILSGNRVLLPGLGDVVVVLVSQVAAPDLEVVPGVHLVVVDVL